jgi:hypothetical protein
MNLNPFLTPYLKINLKYIINVTVYNFYKKIKEKTRDILTLAKMY